MRAFLVAFLIVPVVDAFQQRLPIAQQSIAMSSSASSRSSTTTKTQLLMSTPRRRPKLIVFDLDNTLWTPELYQLRKHQKAGRTPVAHHDVKLLPGARAALERKQRGRTDDDDGLSGVAFAVASRTKSVDWAHDLLDQFGIRGLFDHVEIFPGNKRQHFGKIADQSGVAFEEMLFFDDARDGKYGNCVPVAGMGVLSVHCPTGLHSEEIFEMGLARFHEWDRMAGTIVEWDGTVTRPYSVDPSDGGTERFEGEVKFVNEEKRFGFIRFGDRSTNDVFFHFNSLLAGETVQQGDKLSFGVERDPKNGKNRACNVEKLSGGSKSTTSSTGVTKATSNDNKNSNTSIQMHAFSMNMPLYVRGPRNDGFGLRHFCCSCFAERSILRCTTSPSQLLFHAFPESSSAALMANGYKTLETRNGTMFTTYPEGTQMLLHVGRRTYPDGDKHLQVMKSGGLDDSEIERLKSLPPGFERGMLVAICELGKTYETTVKQRSDPETQRQVAAFGADSGRMVTEIKRIDYLKNPVKMPAQGGVFKVSIDPDLLPDGWRIAPPPPKQDKQSGKPLYSISG